MVRSRRTRRRRVREWRRLLHAEDGVALMTVMLAIFIFTVVVAAMAVGTMGETTLSADQLRGQRALAVAEAGAYRALADLRRRLSVDLDLQVRQPSVVADEIRNICNAVAGRRNIEIIERFAWPVGLGATDWVRAASDPDAVRLEIGTPASRVQIADTATGEAVGDFHATVLVKPSGAPPICQFGADLPEQEIMWFDFAIRSVGRVGNATKAVCLRSPSADRCPDWFSSSGGWEGSHAITSGVVSGWPVLIEKASFAQWALMLLDAGSVWLYTGTQVDGPVHSNTHLRIAGNPALHDVVTQSETDMVFRNCGSPTAITIPGGGNPNTVLRTPGCDNTAGTAFRSAVIGGVSPITPPANASPSRTSIGLSPSGPNATDAEVRARTTDPEAGASPMPQGLYVMNNCGSPACGGLYVKGDVRQMVLSSVGNAQVIHVRIDGDPNPTRRFMKVVIDPATRGMTVHWDNRGGDTWAQSRSYGAGTFNGVFYVNGRILGGSGGLSGMVNRAMRMTLATEGEMRITNHLVYEAPPAGPGHNPANVLGLYSVTSNITIDGSVTPNNLYVDGVVLTPRGKFWVSGWDTVAAKGAVYFLGGTVQGLFGEFGRISPPRGYDRVMTYDWRLRSNVAPPFFPLTDIYTAVRYPSPSVVFRNGDPLYDRPQWEEVAGL